MHLYVFQRGDAGPMPLRIPPMPNIAEPNAKIYVSRLNCFDKCGINVFRNRIR